MIVVLKKMCSQDDPIDLHLFRIQNSFQDYIETLRNIDTGIPIFLVAFGRYLKFAAVCLPRRRYAPREIQMRQKESFMCL